MTARFSSAFKRTAAAVATALLASWVGSPVPVTAFDIVYPPDPSAAASEPHVYIGDASH